MCFAAQIRFCCGSYCKLVKNSLTEFMEVTCPRNTWLILGPNVPTLGVTRSNVWLTREFVLYNDAISREFVEQCIVLKMSFTKHKRMDLAEVVTTITEIDRSRSTTIRHYRQCQSSVPPAALVTHSMKLQTLHYPQQWNTHRPGESGLI